MLVIDRYFNIEAAERDLKYSPVIPLDHGWPQTIAWFKEHWLPTIPCKPEGALSKTRTFVFGLLISVLVFVVLQRLKYL
jgi:hypothetical protein